MCTGKTHDKAERLFEVIIGPAKVEENDENEMVCWNEHRLSNAFKQLLYFSEIFPKKYWNHLMDGKTPKSELEISGDKGPELLVTKESEAAATP